MSDYWMIKQPVSKALVLEIDPKQMAAYLKSKGWTGQYLADQARVSPTPYEDRFRIVPCAVIPYQNHWADYESLLAESLEIICRAEQRTVNEIMLSIVQTEIT